jgi:hypothetical protein
MRATPGVLIVLFAALPVAAATQEDKQACISASEKAQQLRADSKLSASREQLLSCARDVCPAVVRKDCARWLAEVEEALPTIVLAAKDSAGHDLGGVKVTVDDKPFADKLEGKAQPIDPGSHVFKFEREGGPTVSETVLVREGEKNRIVSVTFPSPGDGASANVTPNKTDNPALPTTTTRTVSPAAWVLAGVGTAAFVSFAYFGLSGRSQASDLRSSCAPTCPQNDVDSVKTKLLVADVSLGISLISFGVATYLFLNPSTTESRTVSFTPLPGGGALALAGRF